MSTVDLHDQAASVSELSVRQRVLRTILLWSAVGSWVIGGALALQAILADELTVTLLIGVIGLQALTVLALLRPLLSERVTTLLLLGYLLALSSYFQIFGGPTFGGATVSLSFVMLCTLLYGSRGGLWGFGGALVMVGIASSLNLAQVLQPWTPLFWNPREPLVWVRYLGSFVFYFGALASALRIMLADLEQTTLRLSATLESERRERAKRELAQNELEKAKRLEALAQFAAGVAHDFNNSLTVIMGGASLIRDEPGMPRLVTELASDVIKQAETGGALVRQLLSLGRSDAGQPESVRLDDVLRTSRSTLRSALRERVQLEIEGSSESSVFVDVARLRQSLLNLAINARDAMPEGGSWSLQLSERVIENLPVGWNTRPGRFVTITCTDTGVGIDPKLLDKIFEPFFTTKGAQHGSGLGLPIVRKTIQEAGGFMEIESTPGVGTTIRLNLPAT